MIQINNNKYDFVALCRQELVDLPKDVQQHVIKAFIYNKKYQHQEAATELHKAIALRDNIYLTV